MVADPARYQTFAISITPFTASGAIDETAFRRHLRKLSDAGVGVYVGGGGSGEGYTLSDEETERLLTIAAEEIGGRSPIRAMGVEPRTARQMIAFLRRRSIRSMSAMAMFPRRRNSTPISRKCCRIAMSRRCSPPTSRSAMSYLRR